jgi:phage tail-like protein
MPAVVKDSRSSVKTDPLRNFRFQVNIQHQTTNGSMSANLGFMTVGGLSVETDLIAYRQGGMNTTTQKMPGQTNFPPLSLSRGMMVGTPDEYLWFKEVFSVVAGAGTGPNPANNNDFRADIDIYVLQHPFTRSQNVPVKAKYHVYNAWPQSLSYSDLDAGANGLIMEGMVLQHEGFGLVYAADALGDDVANRTNY